ncbi:hypothetical protein ADUPG1_008302 [Aduncisulcus paluster]|uniref:Protein kinase domain-containing protein n=1 Tax=Aduncisulcus paluster TaxID=2918883 RepID=A0ABQ5KTY8_9EUKA|nr:hypothetical protein ADUPG1_008302 [Aduncisulcus paluster]
MMCFTGNDDLPKLFSSLSSGFFQTELDEKSLGVRNSYKGLFFRERPDGSLEEKTVFIKPTDPTVSPGKIISGALIGRLKECRYIVPLLSIFKDTPPGYDGHVMCSAVGGVQRDYSLSFLTTKKEMYCIGSALTIMLDAGKRKDWIAREMFELTNLCHHEELNGRLLKSFASCTSFKITTLIASITHVLLNILMVCSHTLESLFEWERIRGASKLRHVCISSISKSLKICEENPPSEVDLLLEDLLKWKERFSWIQEQRRIIQLRRDDPDDPDEMSSSRDDSEYSDRRRSEEEEDMSWAAGFERDCEESLAGSQHEQKNIVLDKELFPVSIFRNLVHCCIQDTQNRCDQISVTEHEEEEEEEEKKEGKKEDEEEEESLSFPPGFSKRDGIELFLTLCRSVMSSQFWRLHSVCLAVCDVSEFNQTMKSHPAFAPFLSSCGDMSCLISPCTQNLLSSPFHLNIFQWLISFKQREDMNRKALSWEKMDDKVALQSDVVPPRPNPFSDSETMPPDLSLKEGLCSEVEGEEEKREERERGEEMMCFTGNDDLPKLFSSLSSGFFQTELDEKSLGVRNSYKGLFFRERPDGSLEEKTVFIKPTDPTVSPGKIISGALIGRLKECRYIVPLLSIFKDPPPGYDGHVMCSAVGGGALIGRLKECRYIVPLLSIFKDTPPGYDGHVMCSAVGGGAKRLFLVFPYYKEGDVLHWIRSHDNVGVHELIHVFKCVLHALDHLHSRGIVHCDIKPANVLIDDDNDGLLCDFEGAIEVIQGNAMRLRTSTTPCSTFVYTPPEFSEWMKKSRDYSSHCNGEDGDDATNSHLSYHATPAHDMYSFGALVCELFRQIEGRIMLEQRDIVRNILKYAETHLQAEEIEKRPSAEEALRNMFLTK